MKVAVQLSCLALFLNLHLVLSTKNLTCVNDYINNIACVWKTPPDHVQAACKLHGLRWDSYKSCELKPVAGSNGTSHTCHLLFQGHQFIVHDKILLEVKCGQNVITSFKDFQPINNVKMHPPGSPVITNFNITWSKGSPFSKHIFSYKFQVQYKQETESWENTSKINIPCKQQWIEVSEERLVKGALYQARVRVIPCDFSTAEWSDWSPITTWRTEAGKQLNKGNTELPLGLMTGIIVFGLLILLCLKYWENWLYCLKCQYVPDPSKYFDTLISIHGGNFQKWLSPMFTAESFDILRCSEDISAVEVSRDKTTIPSKFLDYSRMTKHTDGSNQSFLHGFGYLYSRYPSSYEMDPCSVYFSYHSGEGLPGGDKNKTGAERADGQGPLQASYSYECLEKLGNLHGQSQAPNSRCEPGHEDEETDRKEDMEELRRRAHHSSSPSLCPFPAPFQTLPLHTNSHFINCFPQLTYPFQVPEFDLHVAQTTSPPSYGLVPARSSSVKIEPSSSGYMSLQDVKINGGNKSI